ncbi:MAG: hypothetical protein MUF18_21000 [Fimbriiglobus sp.]|jgi:hypothetical protein|nr:hypothetical protein [Fimbriiglobus sp.]
MKASPFLTAAAVFAALLVLLNLAFAVALDYGPPHLRDPEYGLRLDSLRRRMAEHPARPPVVVVGSSRTGQGIRPGVGEPSDGPLVFNLSQSGGGPVSQLLTLRRLWADGVHPAGVVLEYWPPFLRGDGTYHEQHRLDPKRLRPTDEPTVREFFADPDAAWNARAGDSFVPLVAHRHGVVSRICPELLPHARRTDPFWRNLDAWGWWPGRVSATPEQINAGWANVAAFYRPMYADFAVHPQHAAAYRTVLRECRERAVRALLVRMPESLRFRELQTAESERAGDAFLADVRAEFGVPVIDTRGWADADHLPDGFHLTQTGADAFTRRLLPEVQVWWASR